MSVTTTNYGLYQVKQDHPDAIPCSRCASGWQPHLAWASWDAEDQDLYDPEIAAEAPHP